MTDSLMTDSAPTAGECVLEWFGRHDVDARFPGEYISVAIEHALRSPPGDDLYTAVLVACRDFRGAPLPLIVPMECLLLSIYRSERN